MFMILLSISFYLSVFRNYRHPGLQNILLCFSSTPLYILYNGLTEALAEPCADTPGAGDLDINVKI